MFYRKSDGDDAGAGARFENAFFRFDPAEIRKENAVESEAMAFCRLVYGQDARSAKSNRVARDGSHFTFSTYSADRRLGFAAEST